MKSIIYYLHFQVWLVYTKSMDSRIQELERPFTTDRQTAISEALSTLTAMPGRRAAAVFEAIRSLKGERHHFSLVDILQPSQPTPSKRLLKHITPNPETTPLEIRRRIWEQNPQRFAEQLARDDQKRRRETDRIHRLLGQPGLHAGEVIVPQTLPPDQDFKLSLRELSNLFDPISGKIIIPARYNLSSSVFAKFYDNQHKIGYFQSDQGRIELRGQTFYTASQEQAAPEVKLQVIQKDLDKILTIVSDYAAKRGEISNPRDYLLYLGILDLMKHHSITLFHALTFTERLLDFPQNRESFYQYHQYRQQALELMNVSVRMFYQTLTGFDYDQAVNLNKIQNGLPQLIQHIQGLTLTDTDPLITDSRFRVLETSNPFIIALGAYKAVQQHSRTDIIIGIPSGGTETAQVVQLFYEQRYKRSPQLVFLPLSIHSQLSKIKKIVQSDISSFLSRFYPNLFQDKNILLVDDNSETGQTLGMAARALQDNHSSSIAVHLVDLSTRRLTDQRELVKERAGRKDRSYFSPAVSSRSTFGLTQLDERGNYAHNTQRQTDIKNAQLQSRETDRW